MKCCREVWISRSANLLTKLITVQTEVMMKMPAILQPSLVKRSFLSAASAPAMSFIAIIMKNRIAMKSIPAMRGFTMWSNKLLAISFAERAYANIWG